VLSAETVRCLKFPNTLSRSQNPAGFVKATLDLWEKAGFRPLFQEHFLKPTGFWEMILFKIKGLG
jgi:hypothetical protein